MKQRAFSSKPFRAFIWQKAEKEYHCRNCNKLILPGDEYWRSIGKDDFTRQFYDNALCVKCGRDKLMDFDI